MQKYDPIPRILTFQEIGGKNLDTHAKKHDTRPRILTSQEIGGKKTAITINDLHFK